MLDKIIARLGREVQHPKGAQPQCFNLSLINQKSP
jgi:hypothetical protein